MWTYLQGKFLEYICWSKTCESVILMEAVKLLSVEAVADVYTLLLYKKVSVSPFLYYPSVFSKKLLSQCRFNLHFWYYEWDWTSFHGFKNLGIIQLLYCGPLVHNLSPFLCWGCWVCLRVYIFVFYLLAKSLRVIFQAQLQPVIKACLAGCMGLGAAAPTSLAAHCTLCGSLSPGLAPAGPCLQQTCISRPDPHWEVSF